jgi:hypothetical protein
MPVDRVRRETEPFEGPCRTRDREREPLALFAFSRRDAAFGRIASDAALHEFGNETGVADGLRSTVDEEPRKELVVEKAVGLRGLDGRTYFIFGIPAPSETRPEL